MQLRFLRRCVEQNFFCQCKAVEFLYPDSVIVLGDMGELGENEKEFHREVGRFIKNHAHKENIILTVGNLAKEFGGNQNFETNKNAGKYIIQNIKEERTIFFKASRSMKFEEIIDYIKENS